LSSPIPESKQCPSYPAPAAAITADAIVTVSRLAQAIRLFKAIQALGSIYGNLNRWGIIAGDLKNKMTVAQAEQELNGRRSLLKTKALSSSLVPTRKYGAFSCPTCCATSALAAG
jgi:hypothetical protein